MTKADTFRPLPYYRWYWQAWRANRRVQRLSLIQKGAYRELLDECWAEGRIPDNAAKLAEIVGCSVGEMTEMWPTLRTFFVDDEQHPGMMRNPRLDAERTITDHIRVTKSTAGKKGAEAKNAKSSDQGDLLASAEPAPAHDKRRVVKRRGEERREEKRIKADTQELVALWNAKADANGYAKILAVRSSRATHLKARLSEPGWLDRAKQAIAYLQTDSWYREHPDAVRFDTLLQAGKAEYYIERSGVARSSSATSRGGARAGVDSGIHEDLERGGGRVEDQIEGAA